MAHIKPHKRVIIKFNKCRSNVLYIRFLNIISERCSRTRESENCGLSSTDHITSDEIGSIGSARGRGGKAHTVAAGVGLVDTAKRLVLSTLELNP